LLFVAFFPAHFGHVAVSGSVSVSVAFAMSTMKLTSGGSRPHPKHPTFCTQDTGTPDAAVVFAAPVLI